ncbi:hypothetical protein Pst134EA_006734 [Puccinia striiformis f. sp. tritici]|uniref:hypothetical protein n=1 Tax=Puccinia striiformis f. sp. tritici TaxID=168172 RepID=UPI0020075F6D|nr:hypothetical protein Pst134EA_006734 [Puccinia striiformis f. sp. tritici]KAH9469445.1 hypothetical protein Pst134EA_006734 [Puccinia striiformis f. sp. tritici]
MKESISPSTPPPPSATAGAARVPTTTEFESPESEIEHSKTTTTTAPRSFSLWEHLKYEINPEQHEDTSLFQESQSASLRSERISNFLNVPIAIEKTIIFGFWICLDSFLSVLTILPIKFFYSLYLFLLNLRYKIWDSLFFRNRSKKRKRLSVGCKVDLIQGLLIVLVCLFLHHVTDASRMYHSVRGQETIKLYVIFNVLEIADRLCCSFGQDILDSLFSPSTLGRRNDGSQPHMKPIFLFILAFIFTVAHTLVLFYQLVSLNVAINSFDHSLITLLISNQFVEIKGAVFKKFEKENLFQMSCADIVERFQLFLMLAIIAIRNLIEMSGSSTTSTSNTQSYTYHYLPQSLISFSPTISLIEKIISPVIVVMLSEVLVDWLKHAFITKFNHIRPSVYARFIDILCKDLIGDHLKLVKVDHDDHLLIKDDDQDMKPFVDKSPAVSRRLGFSVFPIFCLTVRVSSQAIGMLSDSTTDDEFNLFNDDHDQGFIFDGLNMVDDPPLSLHHPTSNTFSIEFVKHQLSTISSFSMDFVRNFNSPIQYFDRLLLPNPSTSPPPPPPPPPASSSSEGTGSSTFSNFQMKGFITLSIIVVMSFLILIKLYIGIRIRLYAIKRVQTLNQRLDDEDQQQQHGRRNRLPIGLSADEIQKEELDRKLIEKVEFDVPIRPSSSVSTPSALPTNTLHHHRHEGEEGTVIKQEEEDTTSGIPSSINLPSNSSSLILTPLPPSSSDPPQNHHKKKGLSMEELGRFDMVRSRIW